MYASETEDVYKRMYLYEKINEPTIFLYGDTYYEDNDIETIVNTSIEKVMFYGNENAIIAVKVNDCDLFKRKLNIYNGTNTSDDYQSLVKTKKMIKKEAIK